MMVWLFEVPASPSITLIKSCHLYSTQSRGQDISQMHLSTIRICEAFGAQASRASLSLLGVGNLVRNSPNGPDNDSPNMYECRRGALNMPYAEDQSAPTTQVRYKGRSRFRRLDVVQPYPRAKFSIRHSRARRVSIRGLRNRISY